MFTTAHDPDCGARIYPTQSNANDNVDHDIGEYLIGTEIYIYKVCLFATEIAFWYFCRSRFLFYCHIYDIYVGICICINALKYDLLNFRTNGNIFYLDQT